MYRQGTVSRLCDLRVLFVPLSVSIASAALRLSVLRLYNNYRINTTQIRDWPRKPRTYWPVQSPGSRSILYHHVGHLVPVPRQAGGWSRVRHVGLGPVLQVVSLSSRAGQENRLSGIWSCEVLTLNLHIYYVLAGVICSHYTPAYD